MLLLGRLLRKAEIQRQSTLEGASLVYLLPSLLCLCCDLTSD